MALRYQDIYPSSPLLNSADLARRSAAELLTLEYFEAEPDSMPTAVFDQHHILLNLQENAHRVENWRDGEHRDFTYEKDEIVVTPAGVESGWRWHAKSKVIVITMDPEKFERFAADEVGVLLTARQLRDLPQFRDPDLCQAGILLLDALRDPGLGSAVVFESLARVFLVKLIQKYGERREEELALARGFTTRHYKRVLDFVAEHYDQTVSLEDMAREAGLSSSHFSRLFKRTIGQSPMQYVSSYRVEQAKKRLGSVDDPLGRIAVDCGFADQAHFSRVFKRSVGQTPKQYRASLAG